ncbi:MAG: hypothetical protein AAF202_06780, partial [Pseudomonadota bacterium]
PQDSGHAVVILDVDPESQTLVVSDPNLPNMVYETNYSVGPNGKIYFQSLLKKEGLEFFMVIESIHFWQRESQQSETLLDQARRLLSWFQD